MHHQSSLELQITLAPLTQFQVLCWIQKQRLIESSLADFIVTSPNDYLLPRRLNADHLEGKLAVFHPSRVEQIENNVNAAPEFHAA